jgi:diguanylate cyclase (GGDEF)-like protein
LARAGVFEGQERRGKASHHSLAIAVIGIERLRSYVEQHGPAAGETLLKSIGALVQRKCRCTDLPVRLSDDEFLLILPFTPEEGARAVLNRIRREMGSLSLTDEKGADLEPPSIVEGMATYPKDGQKGKDLLRKALERVRH